MRIASVLPFKVLSFMAKHFDDEGAWMLDDAKCFWLDADYWKYVRIEKRKPECICPTVTFDDRTGEEEHYFICPRHPEPWRD